jgi:hypothetical protein
MPKKVPDKLSIYIPQRHQSARIVERLIALGDKRDRSVNHLVVEAVLEYLRREERRRRNGLNRAPASRPPSRIGRTERAIPQETATGTCEAEKIATAFSRQLVVQELPEGFDSGNLSYNEVLAGIRHEYTNYESLLYEMQEALNCLGRAEAGDPCPVNPEEEDVCSLELQAHDILKWAAKSLAEEAHRRWREKHASKKHACGIHAVPRCCGDREASQVCATDEAVDCLERPGPDQS